MGLSGIVPFGSLSKINHCKSIHLFKFSIAREVNLSSTRTKANPIERREGERKRKRKAIYNWVLISERRGKTEGFSKKIH